MVWGSGNQIPLATIFSSRVQTACTKGNVSFPMVKREVVGVNNPPRSRAEVKEIELELYSPSVPSWHVIEWKVTFYIYRYALVHEVSVYCWTTGQIFIFVISSKQALRQSQCIYSSLWGSLPLRQSCQVPMGPVSITDYMEYVKFTPTFICTA